MIWSHVSMITEQARVGENRSHRDQFWGLQSRARADSQNVPLVPAPLQAQCLQRSLSLLSNSHSRWRLGWRTHPRAMRLRVTFGTSFLCLAEDSRPRDLQETAGQWWGPTSKYRTTELSSLFAGKSWAAWGLALITSTTHSSIHTPDRPNTVPREDPWLLTPLSFHVLQSGQMDPG
jgi:hypothetical protein